MADDAMIRKENLRRLGKGPKELATILGSRTSYWFDVLNAPNKPFGEKVARRIEETWPLPRGWLDQPHEEDEPIPAPGNKGVAHDLSQTSQTLEVKELEWGDVMQGALPNLFSLKLRDDALGGHFPAGSLGLFQTGIEPINGRGVLFQDRDGDVYVRNYQIRRGSLWRAVAAPESESKYAPLDSEDDGLTVLAVMVGHRWA